MADIRRRFVVKDKRELTFKEDVVGFLKEEEKLLRKKMKHLLNTNNFTGYKNLIKAYEKVVELIDMYDWQLMYSEYEVRGTDISCDKDQAEAASSVLQRQVAVWEQNGDGLIRNHKIWYVKEPVKNCSCNNIDGGCNEKDKLE